MILQIAEELIMELSLSYSHCMVLKNFGDDVKHTQHFTVEVENLSSSSLNKVRLQWYVPYFVPPLQHLHYESLTSITVK